MFLHDIILVIGAKTEEWEDDSYDDALVGAVVLAVCLEWAPDGEKSELVLFAFLGEEGKGEQAFFTISLGEAIIRKKILFYEKVL